MLYLTAEQHREVLRRLVDLCRARVDRVPLHSEGVSYTSLMICFLLQNLSAAETLLRISTLFGNEWFPATVGYAIARSMFETDLTAHYVTKSPTDRVRRYIEFTSNTQ